MAMFWDWNWNWNNFTTQQFNSSTIRKSAIFDSLDSVNPASQDGKRGKQTELQIRFGRKGNSIASFNDDSYCADYLLSIS
jgi:hypothetical protein